MSPENIVYQIYTPAATNSIPHIFIKNSEYFAIFPIFFIDCANIANNITITHCPIAKLNNNEIENNILDETAANAIILAKIGEAHGLDANANTAPIKNGKITRPLFLFCGIFFTIAGKFISIIPKRLSPRITITDANINISSGDTIDVKARPDSAQITPIILNTDESPSEKNNICTNNLLLSDFEYPPTYPIIKGNIPKLHGDKDAIIPAINDIPIIIGNIK